MKTKIQFITLLTVLCSISTMSFAQSCSGTDVWSCYYYGTGGYFCGCVSSSSTEALQCSGGQVLACRLNQHCDWECECVDTSDLAFWLSHSHKCNGGGGGHGGWHHWHGGYRLLENEQGEINAMQVYPNPITSLATISFFLEQKENISMKLFDMTGRIIVILADRTFEKGENEIVWNASELNAGIYFLQFQSEERVQTKRLIVVN